MATWPKADFNDWKPESCLPLDPYFWFGRLWDRLCEATGDIAWFEVLADSKQMRIYLNQTEPRDAPNVKSNHPCIALCHAIEILEGK